MPETAASPTVETITVSAMPTVTSKSCSSTKGRISLQSACRVNISGRANVFCAIVSPFCIGAAGSAAVPGETAGCPLHLKQPQAFFGHAFLPSGRGR